MKIKFADSKEIFAEFVDGDDVARIVFKAPTAADIVNLQMGFNSNQGKAMLKILSDTFVRFEGEFLFEDSDGNEIKVKDFRAITELGGATVGAVCAKCLEALTIYLNEVRGIEKK